MNMSKTLLLSVITILIVAITCCAQPELLWSQTYGGEYDDECGSLIQTADGGFALAGSTVSFENESVDMWLVKTNANGDSLWSRTYGGRSTDICNSIIQTTDGGYVLAGQTSSFAEGRNDMWMVKVNADGDSLWSRTFGGMSSECCNSIIQTIDGGFALVGHTRSFGSGEGDMWMVKTDADGDLLWSRTFGGMYNERASSIIQTEEGEYILAGETESFSDRRTTGMMWMVKTNADGDSLWSRIFAGRTSGGCTSLIQTTDGGFALAGWWEWLWLLVKTDEEGNSLWSRRYGYNRWFLECQSVIQTADGGYALAGDYHPDMLLLKTNSEGDSLWSENYGRGREEEVNGCQSAIQIEDGSFVLGGYHGIIMDQVDMFLVKTSTDPVNVPDVTKPVVVEDFVLFQNYPNPFNSTTTIRYQLPTPGQMSLAVYNPTWQHISTLFDGSRPAGIYSTKLVADELPTGLYFVRLNASDKAFTQRIVVIK